MSAPPPAVLTTGEAVVDSLRAHGIDTLYALPGVHNDALFDAAARAGEGFRVLHPRHEQTRPTWRSAPRWSPAGRRSAPRCRDRGC